MKAEKTDMDGSSQERRAGEHPRESASRRCILPGRRDMDSQYEVCAGVYARGPV